MLILEKEEKRILSSPSFSWPAAYKLARRASHLRTGENIFRTIHHDVIRGRSLLETEGVNSLGSVRPSRKQRRPFLTPGRMQCRFHFRAKVAHILILFNFIR